MVNRRNFLAIFEVMYGVNFFFNSSLVVAPFGTSLFLKNELPNYLLRFFFDKLDFQG